MSNGPLRFHPLVRSLAAILIAISAVLATNIGSEASGVFRTIWVPLYRQIYGLDCEAAALQMALGHEGIHVSQTSLLNAMGIDWRQPMVDAKGAFHWGDPYTNFVGNPNGSEIRGTGYGTYAPVVGRVARQFGGHLMDAREGFSVSTIYWALSAGHPVVAWVSFDWRRHVPTAYQAFDGKVVQYGSPYEHAVTLYGITPGYVLVNNPWGGYRQWISKPTFEAAFSTFDYMAAVLW
jgi:uncharacterized protein YvpB